MDVFEVCKNCVMVHTVQAFVYVDLSADTCTIVYSWHVFVLIPKFEILKIYDAQLKSLL